MTLISNSNQIFGQKDFPWLSLTMHYIFFKFPDFPWLSLTLGDFDMIFPDFPVCIHPERLFKKHTSHLIPQLVLIQSRKFLEWLPWTIKSPFPLRSFLRNPDIHLLPALRKPWNPSTNCFQSLQPIGIFLQLRNSLVKASPI